MTNYDAPDILIIEDDLNDADLIMRTLKKINLANKIVHLRDGVEALDFLFARNDYVARNMLGRPKLILLDIKMPRIDGIEVLTQIKENEILEIIPVVMMTSSKEERDILRCYKLGASSFVVKPLAFESFVKAVSEIGMYWMLTNQAPIIKSLFENH